MVFSSPIFVFAFLPLVLIAYLIVGRASRNAVLLAASLVFYAWGEGITVALLAILILLNWAFGLALDAAAEPRSRKLILGTAVVVDLAVLLHFKYANFLVDNVNTLRAMLGWRALANTPIALPLGISFFTFHLLSYVIDIYRRVARAQTNPLNFGLYISFFPQLIAGPIIRYHDVASQLIERRVTLAKFASGIERFTVGLGKKVLLANPLGAVADSVFALRPGDLAGPTAWLGILAYTFQIYFDFSGYSDMAIGLGRMFGFEFLENFNYPYIATSMREFWRRWHISLSNWFRDYLYIPLGGDRRGPGRTYFNLLIVFLLCGFWHGAAWQFVVWGLIHGSLLAIERGRFGATLRRLPRIVSHAYVLLAVMIAWVFFRADNIGAAFHYLAAMFGFGSAAADAESISAALDRKTIVLLGAAIVGSTPAFSMLTRDWEWRRDQVRGQTAAHASESADGGMSTLSAIRPFAIAFVLSLSIVYLAGQTYNPFIYFRF